MYLVTLSTARPDEHRLIFCLTDPRTAGYTGPVLERAELELSSLCESSLFGPASVCVVGRDPQEQRRFRLFTTTTECSEAGYQHIGATPIVAHMWSEALREPTPVYAY
jgi:hypothetical protein